MEGHGPLHRRPQLGQDRFHPVRGKGGLAQVQNGLTEETSEFLIFPEVPEKGRGLQGGLQGIVVNVRCGQPWGVHVIEHISPLPVTKARRGRDGPPQLGVFHRPIDVASAIDHHGVILHQAVQVYGLSQSLPVFRLGEVCVVCKAVEGRYQLLPPVGIPLLQDRGLDGDHCLLRHLVGGGNIVGGIALRQVVKAPVFPVEKHLAGHIVVGGKIHTPAQLRHQPVLKLPIGVVAAGMEGHGVREIAGAPEVVAEFFQAAVLLPGEKVQALLGQTAAPIALDPDAAGRGRPEDPGLVKVLEAGLPLPVHAPVVVVAGPVVPCVAVPLHINAGFGVHKPGRICDEGDHMAAFIPRLLGKAYEVAPGGHLAAPQPVVVPDPDHGAFVYLFFGIGHRFGRNVLPQGEDIFVFGGVANIDGAFVAQGIPGRLGAVQGVIDLLGGGLDLQIKGFLVKAGGTGEADIAASQLRCLVEGFRPASSTHQHGGQDGNAADAQQPAGRLAAHQ